MLVTLIGKNDINSVNLPQEITGSYWLMDNNEKLIKIDEIDDKWVVKNSSKYRLINPNNIVLNNNLLQIRKDRK